MKEVRLIMLIHSTKSYLDQITSLRQIAYEAAIQRELRHGLKYCGYLELGGSVLFQDPQGRQRVMQIGSPPPSEADSEASPTTLPGDYTEIIAEAEDFEALEKAAAMLGFTNTDMLNRLLQLASEIDIHLAQGCRAWLSDSEGRQIDEIIFE